MDGRPPELIEEMKAEPKKCPYCGEPKALHTWATPRGCVIVRQLRGRDIEISNHVKKVA